MRPDAGRTMRRTPHAALCLITHASRIAPVVALVLAGWAASGQSESPIYVEDSPAAAEAISRAHDLASLGNTDEAARVLQSLLDRTETLLVPREIDEDLFVETRTRVNEVLLSNPALLARYVERERDDARAMLETGDLRGAERTRLLTPAGFDAALRMAQEQLESARFGAAWVTLGQLETHPSRVGVRGEMAARMAGLVARYLGDESSWGVVERWRREAGLGEEGRTRAERPETRVERTPFDDVGRVDLAGVLTKPLASALMGETQPEPVQRLAQSDSSRVYRDTARVLHALPTVAGDTVYVNDSETITAFDRFTLSRRWRTQLIGPPASPSGPSSSGLTDASGVAVGDPYVVALTGLSLRGRMTRERILAALEADTGDVVWTASVQDLDAQSFDGGMLRGPVRVVEGTVVLTMARSVTRQRLSSVSILGFDLHTGDLRWSRAIGSIGVVQHGSRDGSTELTAIRRGVVYYADRVGVVSAVEVDSGRVRWIRRMARQYERPGTQPDAWEGSGPILTDDGRMVMLSPDRQRIVVLDAETGSVLESVSSIRFGRPAYLLSLGEFLVGVESGQITARRLDLISDDDTESVTLASFPRGGVRGRVVVAGDELMIPFTDGIRMIRVEDENGSVATSNRTVELDEPGQVVAAPGQIISVDDLRVHSYLSWDVAERLLQSRMEAEPRDPTAAITYAELAFRAGRTDRILGAVDAATRTIERDPLAEASERGRGRLFASLLEMVDTRPGSSGESSLDDFLRESLIDRLSRVATTPAEQVSYLMAAGSIYEATGRPELAVERYQEVLSSGVLATTVFADGGRRRPAAAEATRRLRRLIRLEGRGVYAAYEAEAQRRLGESVGATDPARFEEIARAYPVSTHAPLAWREAADRYRSAGRAQKELLALEEGFAASEDLLPATDPVFGEIAGRLVASLVEKDRLVVAAQKIETIRRSYPALVLSADGMALDMAEVALQIERRLGERRRRPRIGSEVTGLMTLEGWAVAMPIDDPRPGLTDRIVLRGIGDEYALWQIEGGELRHRWSVSSEAELLRVDHRAVYLSDLGPGARSRRTVTRLDIETGDPVWTTPRFGDVFDGPDPFENVAGGVPVVDTPLQASAPLADVFALFDTETMVLVERTGRMAAFDLETGRLLWAHDRGAAPVQPVYDVAAGNGFVGVAGLRILPPGRERNRAVESVVAAYEIRTGALLYEHVDEADRVRWIRVTPEGHILAGMDSSLASLDVFRQSVRWRADRMAVRDTIGAWALPGRAVYRDADDMLRIIDTSDGSGDDTPLMVEGRLDTGFTSARILPLGDRFALATRRGVALLGPDGDLEGVDQGPSAQRVLMPEFGERRVVTLGQSGVRIGEDENLYAYQLNVYDLASVKLVAPTVSLELGALPMEMALLDEKILVSAGAVTVVLDAPVEP